MADENTIPEEENATKQAFQENAVEKLRDPGTPSEAEMVQYLATKDLPIDVLIREENRHTNHVDANALTLKIEN